MIGTSSSAAPSAMTYGTHRAFGTRGVVSPSVAHGPSCTEGAASGPISRAPHDGGPASGMASANRSGYCRASLYEANPPME